MTQYTELSVIDQKIFVARIINCMCCSQESFSKFEQLLEEQEQNCKQSGTRLGKILLEDEYHQQSH